MLSTLAQSSLLPEGMMRLVGIGLVGYCLLTIVLFWAYARTRLYPLYIIKILWVSFTFVGFFWLIAMSLADPGPRHGGVASEFMKNPAGPFKALGTIADQTRAIYASSPWWLAGLFGLLLVWRGLIGHPQAQEDSPTRREVRRGFMGLSIAIAAALILLADGGFSQAWWRILKTLGRGVGSSPADHTAVTGTVILLAICGLWALLPLAWRRRWSWAGLIALGLLAAAPLLMSLRTFNWGRYTYGVQNYVFAWKTARMGKYMLNSLMVSVLTVGVTSLCASMAAYALTRFQFVGRNAVLFGFIGAMVIPAQLYIVPLFLIIRDWSFSVGPLDFNFMDSRLGLSLIYAASGLPFAIFLLTGFYRTLPGALHEAAAIDGCSEWRTFTDVFFPLAAPGLATAAIFQFLGVWNEYQFALVFLTNDKLKTLPVGLYNLSVSQQYAANWSALFAGVTILCLPTFLIFVILQERIVAGLTVGAVKE